MSQTSDIIGRARVTEQQGHIKDTRRRFQFLLSSLEQHETPEDALSSLRRAITHLELVEDDLHHTIEAFETRRRERNGQQSRGRTET